MQIDLFALHASILIGGMVIAYVVYMRTLRLQASFNLYRVRDAFVLLVAEERLTEEGVIFSNFYGRINALLAAAPQCGVDHILHSIFRDFGSAQEFAIMLKRARERDSELQSEPAMQEPPVRHAVSEYYRALRLMILSHSNVLRVLYLLFRIAMKFGWDRWFVRLLPGGVLRGIETIDYADTEAEAFAPHEAFAAP